MRADSSRPVRLTPIARYTGASSATVTPAAPRRTRGPSSSCTASRPTSSSTRTTVTAWTRPSTPRTRRRSRRQRRVHVQPHPRPSASTATSATTPTTASTSRLERQALPQRPRLPGQGRRAAPDPEHVAPGGRREHDGADKNYDYQDQIMLLTNAEARPVGARSGTGHSPRRARRAVGLVRRAHAPRRHPERVRAGADPEGDDRRGRARALEPAGVQHHRDGSHRPGSRRSPTRARPRSTSPVSPSGVPDAGQFVAGRRAGHDSFTIDPDATATVGVRFSPTSDGQQVRHPHHRERLVHAELPGEAAGRERRAARRATPSRSSRS